MVTRRIMATSGGFISTDLWAVRKPGVTFMRMLELSGKERPRVCFIHTASGDNAEYLKQSYNSLSDLNCNLSHLELFTQPNAPVRDEILAADVIWVGGGSVANLLALWSLHGVDSALREAYASGTVLGGVSAGSICWHQGGPTDSFGAKLQTVTNGLALLPFGNAVHYDSEAQRRPKAHELIADGTFEKMYATDDGVGILYENEVAVEVLTDRPEKEGPSAYLLERISGSVQETKLEIGKIETD
ncbi:MAG: peptidase E [Actinobacteria bacterium]|nr:peptidase E [Actinomycetota bacterium]